MPRDQEFENIPSPSDMDGDVSGQEEVEGGSNVDMTVQSDEAEGKQMGFMDHLTELRSMLLWIVLGIVIASGICAYFIDFIIKEILLAPARNADMKLQNLQTYGQVYFYFKAILWSGVVLSIPHTLYQIWRFVEPALYNNEKSWAKTIVFFTSFCFIAGITFAYYVMVPPMLGFATDFGTDVIQNITDVNEYWSTLMMVILAAGIFFEMPMVSYVLSRGGLLSPGVLKKYRRHSIVVILIMAAIITPSPDPINQMIVGVPIYILYEISIIVSRAAFKKYAEPLD
ncbi:MAG: twin-arginine translocase subunit TatC [Candidatus Kapaibacteriales bacterium]